MRCCQSFIVTVEWYVMSQLSIPYVPSLPERIETIFELIEVFPGQKSLDLGAGDGRVVIEFAKRGLSAIGLEIDPNLVKLANKNVVKEGLEEKAFIYEKDFWLEDFSKYDVITIYGIHDIMKRLEEKFEKELRPGTIIVSNGFRLPYWEPIAKHKFVYAYKKD
jgi:ribosomal protein L11 methylase PrmA